MRKAVDPVVGSFRDRGVPDALRRSQDRLLPVPPPLVDLLPGGGLARGSVVEVGGAAGLSLALLLASGPSRAGSWIAAVGLADLGLVAAAELGVDLERLVLVDQPGPDRWGAVAASLVEAFDVVVASPGHRVRPADARRLQARSREQGSVLVLVGAAADPAGRGGVGKGSGDARGSVARAWPEVADLSLQATEPVWSGLEQGYGHLRNRQVQLTVGGRRSAARLRHAQLWLPGPDGEVALVEPRERLVDGAPGDRRGLLATPSCDASSPARPIPGDQVALERAG